MFVILCHRAIRYIYFTDTNLIIPISNVYHAIKPVTSFKPKKDRKDAWKEQISELKDVIWESNRVKVQLVMVFILYKVK